MFEGIDMMEEGFFYKRDSGGEHIEQHLEGYEGLMQEDAYEGFNGCTRITQR